METEQTLCTWEEYVNVNTGEYLGEGLFLPREYVEKKQEEQSDTGTPHTMAFVRVFQNFGKQIKGKG